MEPNLIKIACLEDSEFYNMLLCRHLQTYTRAIAEDLDCRIDIQSFTNVQDFLRNIGPETAIVLLDYYLGHRTNAEQVMQQMQRQGFAGKIIILSQAQDQRVLSRTFEAGASEFILKDRTALQRTALVVESMLREYLASA